MNFTDAGLEMRHFTVAKNELEAAAAKEMIRLDAGRLAKRAAHDARSAVRTVFSAGPQQRLPRRQDLENISGMLRDHAQNIPGPELLQIKFVPVGAVLLFNKRPPIRRKFRGGLWFVIHNES